MEREFSPFSGYYQRAFDECLTSVLSKLTDKEGADPSEVLN